MHSVSRCIFFPENLSLNFYLPQRLSDQGTIVPPPWPGDEFTVFVHCPLSSENELEKVLGQTKLDSGQWTSIILIVLCCLPETVQFFVHSLYYLVFSVYYLQLFSVYCLQLFSVRFFAHCPLFNFLSTFFCPLSTVHCPAILSWSGGGVLTYPVSDFFSAPSRFCRVSSKFKFPLRLSVPVQHSFFCCAVHLLWRLRRLCLSLAPFASFTCSAPYGGFAIIICLSAFRGGFALIFFRNFLSAFQKSPSAFSLIFRNRAKNAPCSV